MGGNLYMMDATRALTATRVDLGEKPAVLSGIAKHHITERARQIINDAMDIVGGKGICMGPSNFLGAAYMQMPVSITVEGANILTRSLIIFGQGAIRCHPYVLREMAATREPDRARRRCCVRSRRSSATCASRRAISRARSALGLTGSHFVARAARRRARDAPLLPAADALLGGARVPRRRVDGHRSAAR